VEHPANAAMAKATTMRLAMLAAEDMNDFPF